MNDKLEVRIAAIRIATDKAAHKYTGAQRPHIGM
jgi:hypothetical protein